MSVYDNLYNSFIIYKNFFILNNKTLFISIIQLIFKGDALHKYKSNVYIIMYWGTSSLIVVHNIDDLSFVYYKINGSRMKSHIFKTDSLENR